MLDLLQLKKIEVSFLLTDDKRVHQLNKEFRKIDKATDVLAFAMREGKFSGLAGDVLGDVIVSVETARRQAEERGWSVLDEVTMLLAHGLLHLLGWDHDTPAKDRRMRAETDRLCRAAGMAGAEAPRSRPSGPRSKAGADRALSRKRSAATGRGLARKVQPPRVVKPRHRS